GIIEKGYATQVINAAVSERSIQDADVLSIHAESLFSQDENDGSGDDVGFKSTCETNKIPQELEGNAELEITEDSTVIQKEKLQPVWEGMISPLSDLAEFNLAAFPVSGNTFIFSEILSNEIEMSGMVQPHMVHSYLTLKKIKSSKDIVIVKFEPIDKDDMQAYQDFLLYLFVHKQYAVIGNCPKKVKHFYMAPLHAQHTVPEVFLPFDGPGLTKYDYHILIGVMIVSKHCAQGKNKDRGKVTSKGIPVVIEDEQKATQEGDCATSVSDFYQMPHRQTMGNMNATKNAVSQSDIVSQNNERYYQDYNLNSSCTHKDSLNYD
ncbi:unnamed protein product, partial [Meganyctiphanes norvegica]